MTAMWIYNGNTPSSLSLQTPVATSVAGLLLRPEDKDEGEFGHRARCNLIEIALINLFVFYKAQTKLQITMQHSEQAMLA